MIGFKDVATKGNAEEVRGLSVNELGHSGQCCQDNNKWKWKIVMEGKRKKTKKNTLQPASKYFAHVDKDELVPNRTLFKDPSSQWLFLAFHHKVKEALREKKKKKNCWRFSQEKKRKENSTFWKNPESQIVVLSFWTIASNIWGDDVK